MGPVVHCSLFRPLESKGCLVQSSEGEAGVPEWLGLLSIVSRAGRGTDTAYVSADLLDPCLSKLLGHCQDYRGLDSLLISRRASGGYRPSFCVVKKIP